MDEFKNALNIDNSVNILYRPFVKMNQCSVGQSLRNASVEEQRVERRNSGVLSEHSHCQDV